MYLFFFLPLIVAAEYLGGRLVIVVFASTTAAFGLLISVLSQLDTANKTSISQAFVRVFLGREFFLVGLVTTAWYLFRLERIQKDRLTRIWKNLKTLLDFSLRTNQIFAIPDLLSEVIRIGSESLSATQGIAIATDFAGNTYETPKSLESFPAFVAEQARCLRAVAASGVDPERHSGKHNRWVTEYLDVAGRRVGALSFVLPEARLNPEDVEFLKTLTVPLANSLQRLEILASLRRINRETLSTLEFDRDKTR